MKRIYLLFSLLAVLFSFSVNGQKDNDKPQIIGSGNIVSRDIPIQSFDELEVKGVFNVILSQGAKEGVKIEGDDNLLDLFEIRNEGSKLQLNMKKDANFSTKKGLKVYVSFKKLKSMELKTVGNVSSEHSLNFDKLSIDNASVGSVDLKLTAQSINVENKSVGNVVLDGKAENAVIRNNSVGSFRAGSFVVQKMDIDNKGIGSAEVNAEKELKVNDSMMGKVKNKGAASPKRVKRVEI